MNEEAISYIMQKMSNCLDNSQMIRLEKTLEEAGIKLYGGASGSADAAVEALIAGKLAANGDANCDHHDHEHGEGHSCGHGRCHE